MEELSVQQVIDFSQTIEEESHKFYTAASKRLTDPELKALAEELAAEEVDHLNRLRRIVKLDSVLPAELKKRVHLDTDEYERVVASDPIPEKPTARDILERALARETATAATYRTLMSMTNLAADVVELFTYLANQEAGHVTTIRRRLERL